MGTLVDSTPPLRYGAACEREMPDGGDMVAITTLRDELRAALETRHSRHHPYYHLWREGNLSREAIAGWVQEHYHFTKDIPWLGAVMPTRVPYADVRAVYQESID